METLNETEYWLKIRLDKFAKDYVNQENRSNSFCTHQIKKIIGDFGINEGFKVCASGFPSDFEKEWLYDMVWYKENENGELIFTELVMETEMSYGLKHIKFDFEKLLLANSNYRVMICCAGNITLISDIKEYCERAVDSYSQLKVGDRFLILIWDDWYSGDFIYHLIVKK